LRTIGLKTPGAVIGKQAVSPPNGISRGDTAWNLLIRQPMRVLPAITAMVVLVAGVVGRLLLKEHPMVRAIRRLRKNVMAHKGEVDDCWDMDTPAETQERSDSATHNL